MSQKYEKLKTLLKELFQLDQPDLDFGLYRIMHAKATEVSQFLDKDLLPQVKQAFGLDKTADKAELEKELAKVVAGVQAAGMDSEQSPKVRELRAKLASDAVDVGALENEVYDHLFSFFRRYYSEGDFLAKRVYKPGVYAIPYEGEEVKLHWANRDQYYIKTSEYLRDYAFRLRPDNDKKPMRVHFRLIDVAEGEHGNVKAAEGKDRVFILAAPGESGRDFMAEEDGEQGQELSIRFEYRPATLTDWPEDARAGKGKPPVQKDLIALAEQRVLAASEVALVSWIAELGKAHIKADGERADYTRLRAHLNRYTARNTFDYFIHKDLSGFLRRELDFYIKNEVIHLDDIESESAPRVEQYLSKIKVIRQIAVRIIDFLAQLEGFQKKLWLKKKFVVETQYCITLDRIPEEFYPEIAANDAQRQEWVRLFAIRPADVDCRFLTAKPCLPVDTCHFAASFKDRLVAALGGVDEGLDGIVFNGDNFHALRLMQSAYRQRVKSLYIDPPYNTGNDGFAYKDSYQHSSWLALLSDRMTLAHPLMSSTGIFACSIDDREVGRARLAFDEIFSPDGFVSDLAVVNNLKGRQDRKHIATAHEHLLIYEMPEGETFGFPLTEERASLFALQDVQGFAYELRDLRRRGGGDRREDRPNMFFPIFWNIGTRTARLERISESDIEILPKRSDGSDGRWRWGMDRVRENLELLEAKIAPDGQRWNIDYRVYLDRDGARRTKPKSFWCEPRYSTDHAGKTLKGMLPGADFTSPKPVGLLTDFLIHTVEDDDLVCDFFAGSGTTGHASIQLRRRGINQAVRIKYLLVEFASYFDDLLIPRLKKAAYSSEWDEGVPQVENGLSHSFKYIRLESYEDALNNLETRRSPVQRSLLDTAEAQGADKLKEQYVLRYMLDVETRGSQSLLNVQAFTDPTAYKLKVKRPGSDESREVNVDLLETFNWLIGLTVRHIAAPQTFVAGFERDSEGRLRLKGRLKSVQCSVFSVQQETVGGAASLKTEPLKTENSWWFRTVTGTTPDGRKTLIIWRKRPGGEMPDGIEQDNLVLDEWFTRQGYSSKDSEFDLIYVNGSNNLENLKAPDDTWKVRLIEEDFHRLMFETEGE